MASSRVLIVDDDACIRALLGVLASRDQHSVVCAGDGEAALRELAGGPFDAMMLDLLLPRRNGVDVIRYLKCTQPAMLARTIVITAASEATLQSSNDELRLVRRVFRKPVQMDLLIAELRACIAVARKTRAGRSSTGDSDEHAGPRGTTATAAR